MIFYAVPRDPEQKPKTESDYESMAGKWATFEDISEYYEKEKVRGSEIYVWAKHIIDGGMKFLNVSNF